MTNQKPQQVIKAQHNLFALTGRLRWLKTGSSKVLQQEWRDVFTNEKEWREVEIVLASEANGD